MRPRATRVAAWLLAVACSAHALPPAVQTRWPTLGADAQAQLLAREHRLAAMSPTEREALRQRLAAWRALSAAERAQRREAWQAWHALPIEQRARLDAVAARHAALDPQARDALRAEFDALDASERRGWLLGSALGRDYPRLHAMIAQVPADQRAPLLAVLEAMTPAERADLGVLAQRTPPEARDALRRALLAAPPAQRALWLRERLDR